MIKKLVRHGNSWALVIDRPILELLKINPEEPIELTTDGNAMIMTPIDAQSRQARVREARVKINARHQAAFKKLAE